MGNVPAAKKIHPEVLAKLRAMPPFDWDEPPQPVGPPAPLVNP